MNNEIIKIDYSKKKNKKKIKSKILIQQSKDDKILLIKIKNNFKLIEVIFNYYIRTTSQEVFTFNIKLEESKKYKIYFLYKLLEKINNIKVDKYNVNIILLQTINNLKIDFFKHKFTIFKTIFSLENKEIIYKEKIL